MKDDMKTLGEQLEQLQSFRDKMNEIEEKVNAIPTTQAPAGPTGEGPAVSEQLTQEEVRK